MFKYLLGAAAVAVGAALALRRSVVPEITLPSLIEWFHQQAQVREAHPGAVGFTLLRRPAVPTPEGFPAERLAVERRSKAPVVLVQGFFDERTGEVVTARVIEAEAMDEDVRSAHSDTALVLYR